MALWIPITIAAAFLQNLRSAVQQRLKGQIGPTGAVFVRFGYGLPFALGYAAFIGLAVEPPPAATAGWAGFMVLGAASQIAATAALLASFDSSGFGVGTAFSKTEPIQAALFGAVILGDHLSALATVGVLVGVCGVVLASGALKPGAGGWRALGGRGALLGLVSAALFGLSAVSFRAASLSLDDGGFLIRAALTLAAATTAQALGMGVWMAIARADELRRVGAAWRPGLLAGAAGAAASACWFTAMTLEPAAHVRALGQIELVFTFAASALIFGERPGAAALAGVGLIVLGVLALLLGV